MRTTDKEMSSDPASSVYRIRANTDLSTSPDRVMVHVTIVLNLPTIRITEDDDEAFNKPPEMQKALPLQAVTKLLK